MDAGSSVSRRTRGSEAAYFRYLRAMKNNPAIHHTKNPENTLQSQTEIDSVEDYVISSDDCDSGVEKKKKKKRKKREHVLKEKGPRKVSRPAKRARVMGKIDFARLLETGVEREEKDLVRENPVPVDDREKSALPLKFKFEEEEEEEKTEFDMEIDRLFDDLEAGLWESESGQTPRSCVTDDECSAETEVDESPAAWCSRGEHEQILDEQIGIICRFCHDLLLDIKYVLPPFVHVESPEKSEPKKLEKPNNHDHKIHFSNNVNLESKNIPSKGTVFDLIPSSDKELYLHQLEGFELMWRNIAGATNIDNLKTLPSNGGQGCIISHAPGTGKTRLTIIFLQTFMRLYPGCLPVIIAPRGMLLTWAHELEKWKSGLDFHNLNDTKMSEKETTVAEELGQQKSTDYIRFIKMLCWMKGGSILGVGYRLFEELTHQNRRGGWFKKILLESPSLLVLDEGHTPRNDKSLMWEALSKVGTKRRIILSGTPFQNSLDELHNTLALVRPDIARSIPRNSTATDAEIKKLRSMIRPFVHTHKANVTLPGIRHCLIILNPTPLQQKLLSLIEKSNRSYLKQDHLASLVSLHPWLVSEREEFQSQRKRLKSLQLDPNAGVKTEFLIKLIHLSSRLKEKVLIFSDFLDPLRHLQKLLKTHFRWSKGQEVMYIDGELRMEERQRLITSFNEEDSKAKVMLASKRACCEGISLVGASRVVFVDVSWNPSVQRQAMCRAYRLGQQKMVYVYHLVVLMEIKKFAAQAEKDRISNLIFSTATVDKGEGEGGEDEVLEAMVDHQGMIERIIHQPKESDFMKDLGLL